MMNYNCIDNNAIVCGKFDKKISLNSRRLRKPTIRTRIGSKNPKKFKPIDFIPIATDGQVILYRNKTYQVREFLSTTDRKILCKIIVLTIKERNLILKFRGQYI